MSWSMTLGSLGEAPGPDVFVYVRVTDNVPRAGIDHIGCGRELSLTKPVVLQPNESLVLSRDAQGFFILELRRAAGEDS